MVIFLSGRPSFLRRFPIWILPGLFVVRLRFPLWAFIAVFSVPVCALLSLSVGNHCSGTFLLDCRSFQILAVLLRSVLIFRSFLIYNTYLTYPVLPYMSCSVKVSSLAGLCRSQFLGIRFRWSTSPDALHRGPCPIPGVVPSIFSGELRFRTPIAATSKRMQPLFRQDNNNTDSGRTPWSVLCGRCLSANLLL